MFNLYRVVVILFISLFITFSFARESSVKPDLVSIPESVLYKIEEYCRSSGKRDGSFQTYKQCFTERFIVANIQANLRSLGISAGRVDGIYGAKTKRAIQSFQKTVNLPPDGLASLQLLELLVQGDLKALVSIGSDEENNTKEYRINLVPPPSVDNIRVYRLYMECVSGNPRACSTISDVYNPRYYFRSSSSSFGNNVEFSTDGIEQSYTVSSLLNEWACEGGINSNCASLGQNYTRGVGREMSESKGIPLLLQACDNGEYLGCLYAADFYDNPPEGRQRSYEKAYPLYRSACDLGDTYSCDMANSISR